MQKYRWVFVLGIGVPIVLLSMLWIGSQSSGTRLGFIFVGYSNELLTPATDIPATLTRDIYLITSGDTLEVGPERVFVPTALLLVTNAGSVALELFAAVSPGSFSATDFARPSGTGLPRLLKPGESTLVRVVVDARQGPWWTEVGYQRRALRDRVYGWASDSGNAALKAWAGSKLPPIVLVKFGPVTSQPPSGYSLPERLSPILRPNPPLEDLMF